MCAIDIEGRSDGEPDFAIRPLEEERKRRDRAPSAMAKERLARSSRRGPRCPDCQSRLTRYGRRIDGVALVRCPSCGRVSSRSANTSLASSKLTAGKIRDIILLIRMDRPDWVIADIAGVNIKTAQFWVD